MKIKFTYRPRIKNSVVKKNISRLLALGILFNSFNFNSYASTLSEDTRYETFIDSNITVKDVLEDDKTNIKIEGNTLVNHIDSFNELQGTIWEDLDGKLIYNSENITENSVNGGLVWNVSAIKPNTEYSFIIKVNEFTYSDSLIIHLDNGHYISSSLRYFFLENGYNVVTFRTKEKLLPKEDRFKISVVPGGVGIISIDKDVMILEGDYTNEPIPEYFKGMQSSFENQLVTQEIIDNGEEKQENLGKYKVGVKSTGKNIFNNMCTFENGYIETGSGNIILNRNYKRLIKLPELLPNTTYNISFNTNDANTRRLIAVNNGVSTLIKEEITNSFRFTTNNSYNSTYYLQPFKSNETVNGVFLNTSNDGSDADNGSLDSSVHEYVLSTIQLEEGSVATPYEPYKELINTFYLNSPLLEGDTIEYINGQAHHVKRYKEVVLDGSENWIQSNTDINIETTRFYTTNMYDAKNNGVVLSDKFRTRMTFSENHSDTEYISLIGFNPPGVYINLLTSRLQMVDIEGFKQWLLVNPLKIVYQLAEPIYKPIKADLSVQLFEGTTHISNNSNIPVNMEITVDRTLNRATEAIELAKINPNVENISKARMWSNLLKESIKKDELQGQINNITNINGLVIEKKTVNNNIDLYIKPLNSLSISLSTNHIVFEDYSSVSDVDMSNAVQITINSSLPYQLNSYLMTDIQNASGSSKIDKDKLNIKESNDTEYKQFFGLNQKLVLKDECEQGNNIIHNIDLKLKASTHDADIYKTTIKFEAEQK